MEAKRKPGDLVRRHLGWDPSNYDLDFVKRLDEALDLDNVMDQIRQRESKTPRFATWGYSPVKMQAVEFGLSEQHEKQGHPFPNLGIPAQGERIGIERTERSGAFGRIKNWIRRFP